MKTKLLLFTVTGLAIAASAPTFAADTASPLGAKSAAPPTLVTTYANATVAPVQVEPSGIATVKRIAGAKVDIKTIADAKSLRDPDWKTLSAKTGVLDDGWVTLKTALISGSPQGGGESGSYSATTTLAAGTGSSTAAPAIGYSVTDLAKLIKPERTAVVFITA